MSDRSETLPADRLSTTGSPRAPRSTAVTRCEQKLAALNLKIAQAKRKLHKESVREQSIREATVGRAVLSLIEQGAFEPAALALVRHEVHKAMTPARFAAFIGTVFEMPAMQGRLVEEKTMPVPSAEPNVTFTKPSPSALFGLPRRQPST